jgi:hypothetical protein
MGRALETPVSFPAEMAFGMMLKLSRDPKALIRGAYKRCDEEMSARTGAPSSNMVSIGAFKAVNPL